MIKAMSMAVIVIVSKKLSVGSRQFSAKAEQALGTVITAYPAERGEKNNMTVRFS
jgi:hypothetical protein